MGEERIDGAAPVTIMASLGINEECINKGMGGLHFRSGKQGKPNVKSTVKTAMAKGTKKEFIGQVCYVKAQPEHTIAEAFLNWMK